MQTEKLTSFYGKTKRESGMGNFKVFAADNCLTGLKLSLASLKIICLSYSTVCCNDNVFSPTINDRNQHAIQ